MSGETGDMSASRISRLGWYARRAAAMSPAEVTWRTRDQVLRVLAVIRLAEVFSVHASVHEAAGSTGRSRQAVVPVP